MKIFCIFHTVNISKRNFLSVICIAKNIIWTTLKVIFSIFRFFCTLRFQIFKYLWISQILPYHNKTYINETLIYSAFIWCSNLNFRKLTLMTGFVFQGHIYSYNAAIILLSFIYYFNIYTFFWISFYFILCFILILIIILCAFVIVIITIFNISI